MYNNKMFKLFYLFFLTFIFIYKSSFSNVNKDMALQYLESFTYLSAKFIQINNNGDVLSGKILINRPGKARIEYNEIPLLLISDGKKFVTINKKIKSITYYNLVDIPVNLLLYKNFKKENIIISTSGESENQVKLKISDKKRTDQSYIEVIFEQKPFIMKKWTVFRDPLNKTEVLLNDLILNEKNLSSKFNIDKEDPRPSVLKNY